jgi:hypothetical protein
MNAIALRPTIESLYKQKVEILKSAQDMARAERDLNKGYEAIGWHSPYRMESSFKVWKENRDSLAIDQGLWRYLTRLYHLERYMLCSDWDKMLKQIDNCETPEFTIENAEGWLAGLKDTIHENSIAMIKQVYSDIVNGVYYVGGGYNADKKKRNNNGVDSYFILRTHDWQTIYDYWRDSPSVMDDLEKACYLLDGQPLPDKTLRSVLHSTREPTAENAYIKVKLCKNGNTHFELEDGIRTKLNRYGPSGVTIGEAIKIKVFE